jgi:MoaA/NifB/PqqE/SkfB family radical SAM enzyme
MRLDFAWLEITGKCSLHCEHCYAESGPMGTHGTMRTQDWHRIIDEIGTMGARSVQFIGGEPTLHPHLPAYVGHALEVGPWSQ